MEAVSGEKKIKGLYKQIYEEMKKARRREKYLSCFAVFVALICLALVGCAFGWFIAIIIESIYYRWRLEICSSLFLKEKTEGKPPVHDQPERRSIIWIDIFTLNFQDEDIDPINQSGLVVVHHGLLGSIPRWE